MAEQVELELEGTVVLERIAQSTAEIIVLEGGTGSSKTMSAMQYVIGYSFEFASKRVKVTRKTLPALKDGAMDDFRRALLAADCEELFEENKSSNTFTNRQTGTRIVFKSTDTPQKARGPRQDLLVCDEANELSEEDFRQLEMRTRGRVILSYNPSMQKHWIYSSVLTRADCELICSTYKDNPYLTPANIARIEIDVPVYQESGTGQLVKDWTLSYTGPGVLISGDPFRWAVFGLGQRGAVGEAIYRTVFECATMPDVARVLGLDFGWNHPTVLLDAREVDMAPRPRLYFDQLIHESYLTTADLIARLPTVGVTKTDMILADSAAPGPIEEVRRAGYNIQPVTKGAGSVKDGIDHVKRYDLYFTARSTKTKDEFRDYCWQKKADGTILDIPVKRRDDGPDAGRYAASHWSPIAPVGPKAIKKYRVLVSK